MKITKTPKCFVGGAFIRSESGRVYELCDRTGAFLANIPQCSRKDLRNAVEAAAKAGAGWAKRTPYNRGQIIYRIAEMLESRADELVASIGMSDPSGMREVRTTINRTVHYAGWADKFEQVLGSVNPVSGPYFNFTITEPVGVVGLIASEASPLLSLLSLILPAIVSGNTVVALASRLHPYPSILLGEILAVSDLPAGVVNLLTGDRSELLPTFATHEHIRVIGAVADKRDATLLEQGAAETVKRVKIHSLDTDWFSPAMESPYAIRDFTESKTVWHPVGA